MTEEFLTDDEQLEHVKRLSAEYGPWIAGAVLIATVGVFGWRYYQSHLEARALAAAQQFSSMTDALQHDDRTKTRQIAGRLIEDYPDSPYADQAKLILARLYVDDGQGALAIPSLSDVMDHSKDTQLRHIARLRLARVLIDQGKPDDAIKTLADEPGAFAASYHEVRGDAYYAKQALPQALIEYKAALAAGTGSGDADAALLALKIADLGATAAAAAPPIASAAPPAAAPNKAKP